MSGFPKPPVSTAAGCQLVQEGPARWKCLTHDVAGPEWIVAQAMGGAFPCQVPGDRASRKKLASEPTLDPTTAIMLAYDASREVRRELAANRRIPAQAQQVLCNDALEICGILLRNPSAEKSILERFIRGSGIGERAAALSNPAWTAPFLVEELRRFGDSHGTRLGVAANPNTPEPVVRQLAQDETLWMGLAINPAVPPDILATLLDQADARGTGSDASELGHKLLGHPAMTEELLLRVQPAHWHTLGRGLQHPAWTDAGLRRLAQEAPGAKERHLILAEIDRRARADVSAME